MIIIIIKYTIIYSYLYCILVDLHNVLGNLITLHPYYHLYKGDYPNQSLPHKIGILSIIMYG